MPIIIIGGKRERPRSRRGKEERETGDIYASVRIVGNAACGGGREEEMAYEIAVLKWRKSRKKMSPSK